MPSTSDQPGHGPAPDRPVPASAPSPHQPTAAPSAAVDVAARVPLGLRVAAAWSWRLLLVATVVAALVWAINQVRLVAFPVVIALLVAALLRPSVVRLRQLGLGARSSGAVVFVLAVLVLTGVISYVSYQISTGLPELTSSVTAGWDTVHHWLATGPLKLDDARLRQLVDQLRSSVSSQQGKVASGALQGAASVFEVVTGAVLALVVSIFFVVDGDRIADWLFSLLPERARGDARTAGDRAWQTLTGYVRGTVVVAFVDAVGIGVGAAIIGVPLAAPIGVVTFLGAFVPIVGATAAGVIAVLVALVSNGLIAAVIMLGIVLAVQQIEAHLLQPFLLGRAVRVHPLAVIVSVTAGGILAGIGGAVIAVPLVAVLKSVITFFARERALPLPVAAEEKLGALPDDGSRAPHGAAGEEGAAGDEPGESAPG